MLRNLATKKEIDAAIKGTQDKVLVLRFGRAEELGTMQQDEIVSNKSDWEEEKK